MMEGEHTPKGSWTPENLRRRRKKKSHTSNRSLEPGEGAVIGHLRTRVEGLATGAILQEEEATVEEATVEEATVEEAPVGEATPEEAMAVGLDTLTEGSVPADVMRGVVRSSLYILPGSRQTVYMEVDW
jgi:hypothetical protein